VQASVTSLFSEQMSKELMHALRILIRYKLNQA
jgi:hypothetical protein